MARHVAEPVVLDLDTLGAARPELFDGEAADDRQHRVGVERQRFARLERGRERAPLRGHVGERVARRAEPGAARRALEHAHAHDLVVAAERLEHLAARLAGEELAHARADELQHEHVGLERERPLEALHVLVLAHDAVDRLVAAAHDRRPRLEFTATALDVGLRELAEQAMALLVEATALARVADLGQLEEHGVLIELVGARERLLEEPHVGDRPQHRLALAQRQARAEVAAIEAAHAEHDLCIGPHDLVVGELAQLELLADLFVATLARLDLPG